MINISIDPALYDTYPDIRLGVLQYHAEVLPSAEEFWAHMHTSVLPDIQAFIQGKGWEEIPGVRGSRRAYKAFGRSSSRFRVSSEALLRRVRRGDELYHINTVVDVNNMLSVQSGLSVGSYDLSKVRGPVVLRKAMQGEGYYGIGKEFIDMENLLVLADEEGIFGSTMSDSTRAMVTEEAEEILTVLYCFEKEIDLEALLADSIRAFETFAHVTALETCLL